MTAPDFKLGSKMVGKGKACFIIAEAGVNHNGDLAIARRLVEAAAQAGADAVKFQTFDADRLVAPDAPKAEYQKQSTPADESQHAMLRALQLPANAEAELKGFAESKGLAFLTTPFDERSADAIENLVDVFKVPSGELTNLPFLRHLAAKGKPMIVSTGMSTLEEVLAAQAAIREAGDPPTIFLQCVTAYPAEPSDTNLAAMATLSEKTGCPSGFSDHSSGIELALAAAALGATVIEKHFTLDRTMKGPDHAASLEPPELAAMVQGIRKIESALGDGVKRPADAEMGNREVARKSVAAAQSLPKGHTLTPQDLICLRPGTGLPPARLADLAGRSLARDIQAGTLLAEEDLA